MNSEGTTQTEAGTGEAEGGAAAELERTLYYDAFRTGTRAGIMRLWTMGALTGEGLLLAIAIGEDDPQVTHLLALMTDTIAMAREVNAAHETFGGDYRAAVASDEAEGVEVLYAGDITGADAQALGAEGRE